MSRRRLMLRIAEQDESNGLVDVPTTDISNGKYSVSNRNTVTLTPTIKSWTIVRLFLKTPVSVNQGDVIKISCTIIGDKPYSGIGISTNNWSVHITDNAHPDNFHNISLTADGSYSQITGIFYFPRTANIINNTVQVYSLSINGNDVF